MRARPSFSSLAARLLVFLILLPASSPVWPDVASIKAEFYSEPGSHSQWRQQMSTVDERVDPFNGSLQLSYVDLVVPGNGGLDIKIQRHYSSNVLLTRPNPFSNPPYPSLPLPDGPAGLGWTIDFGRVVRSERDPSKGPDLGICATYTTDAGHDTSENPVLELPDGSQHMLAVSATGASLFITKSNWLANCHGTSEGLILYAPNGLKYTMNHLVAAADEVTYTTRLTRAWYPTRIEDSNGNFITISYQGRKGSHALIQQVTSSDGRVVDFTYYADNYLQTISANGQTWTYEYETPAGVVGHKLLSRVIRPDSLIWQYQYHPATAQAGRLSLDAVTYPYGATVSFTYDHVDFVGNVAMIGGDPSSKYFSVVVASKTQGGNGVAPGTWQFVYQPGTESTIEPGLYNDLTSVTFPGGRHVYRHYGMQRQLGIASQVAPRELWKSGLLKEKETYTQTTAGYVLLDKEVYAWEAPTVISFEDDPSLPYDYKDFNVYYPQLASKTVVRDGTSYVTQYNYERLVNGQNVRYPRPQFKTETGQAGEANQVTRNTELVWYPADPAQVWLFDQVIHEIVENSDAFSVLREFDFTNANMLAYQPYGVVERYVYHPDGTIQAGNIQTKTNARGFIWQYNDYHRGVPRQEIHPVSSADQISINRTVNNTGTVATETNGRGYLTSYQYDGMNRPTLVDLPLGADTTVQWNPTGKTVTRGTYRQTRIFDGFGRAVCVDTMDTSSGSRVTQTLEYNVLGHKRFESYPFQGACPATGSPAGDVITTDAMGRMTRVDHADGTFAINEYLAGNAVRHINERGLATTQVYRSFGDPDNTDEKVVMRIDSPENISTVFTRNIIGQALTVIQGTRNASGQITSGVTRSYTYDPNKNFLLTETNPEAGTTVYTRDGVGNMTSRVVGSSGLTQYIYDRSNRLTTINYPGSSPDVSLSYDRNHNLTRAYNTTGFVGNAQMSTERLYGYDQNDNLETESMHFGILLNIGGQISVYEDKTLSAQYGYDALDNLSTISYPSGQIVGLSPDALGRPTTVSPFVTAVGYHPNGQPASLNYANGRQTTVGLNSRQWIQQISTSGGLVSLAYGYDGRGNVGTITDGINSQNNRTLGYDGVDRLTSASGVWGSGSIGYDAVGNIRSQNLGSVNLGYTYGADNRLASVSGTSAYSFTYDAYGNVAGNSRNTFTYDDAGNLRSMAGASVGSYFYDGNNMRARADNGTDVLYHFYARSGELLGEYSKSGTHSNEYAYLGGKLVAMRSNLIGEPVANAGPDQTVVEGAQVTLDGSASSDPGGSIAKYSWSQNSGPAVALNGANTANPTFTAPPVAGANTVLTFVLTVTDNGGISVSDEVTVTVTENDTDGDGLLDAWETQHFGNLDQDANGDPDSDGLSNMQEFNESTDPTVTAPPPVVVGTPVAKAGDTQNKLTWTRVIGAAHYNIYWSLSPGVTKATGNKITANTFPFTHTGLANGARYYYVVTAENAVGESPDSTETSAAPGFNQWGAAIPMEADVWGFHARMNNAGETVLLWNQWKDNSYLEVWTRRYAPESGWTTPVKLADMPDTGLIDAAIDVNGNATAVWESNNQLYAMHYTPAEGWGSPVQISNNGNPRIDYSTSERHVAMDGSGNALVAWSENGPPGGGSGITSYVKVSRYDAQSQTWSPPFTLETRNNGWIFDVHVATYENGNAIAVWKSFYLVGVGTFQTSVHERQYVASTNTWGTSLLLSAGGENVGLATDAAGGAMVTWELGAKIWARRFDPVSGWDAPSQQISNAGSEAGVPEVVADASGNAIVAWNSTESDERSVIYANRYNVTTGTWGAPQVVGERGNDYTAFSQPIIAEDDAGNAVVLWLAEDYDTGIWGNWYSANQGWQGAYPIQRCTDPVWCRLPTVAAGGSRGALAVWKDFDDVTSTMKVSHYDFVGSNFPSPNVPPVVFAGPIQSAVEGASVTLNGSVSTDPDGNIVAYQWTQVDGPSVTLNGSNTQTPSFIAPQVDGDTWIAFRLTVTDNGGANNWDVAEVEVTNSSNSPPTANAGADQTVAENSSVTLNGSGSSDPDGTITSYQWIQTAGPAVTLAGTNTSTATFTAPFVTTDVVLTFALTVTDNLGVVNTDSVNVTVQILDSDADGLSDYWEQGYFGNLSQGANGDADFDGITNQQEFQDGTDPTVPAPAAVTGVSAASGDGQNTISWSAASGAASYNLYWSSTPGVTKTNGTKVAGATSPYLHAGLTNGAAYYYIVTALNSGGESGSSAEVSAIPGGFTPDGDLNVDGVVDVADVLLAENIALGLTVPTGNQLLHGDVVPVGNPDGVIDAADVARIRRTALGLENF